MGILRADRVAGLGGANAINGSVRFSGNYLDIADVDTAFGTGGDWTMECWINPQEVALKAITDPRTGGSTVHPLLWISGGNGGKAVGVLYYYTAGADRIVGTTVLQSNTWYHVAVVRNSGTTHLYVNGTSEGSFSDTLDYASTPTFRIGARYSSTPYNYDGYISNFRLINGTALYTANFTPPAQRLENISGTEILCCQSPGNVEQEATGKTITAPVPTNGAAAQASHFAPDKGEDHGTTFADNTKFDTLSYMVPPGGTTTQSNRGRAVSWWGIYNTSGNYTKDVDYFDIQSLGTTTKFGEISDTVGLGAGMSSSTRGVFAGGTKPGVGNMNLLEYITIATTGNAVDFGGVSTTFRYGAGISNQTRGLIAGAYQGSGASGTLNTIQYITIANLGDTVDFGDLVANSGDGIQGAGSCSSTTRGITFGGGTPTTINEMNYITIMSTGNSVDFGDLSAARYLGQGVSSSTRGVVGGGDNSGAVNIIEYITIATTGNATDFGDMMTAREHSGSEGGSNGIRGVFVGGGDWPAGNNTMEYITIATTGNTKDFGDSRTAISAPYGSTTVSDCHGGIS